jgi:hypothetical protein
MDGAASPLRFGNLLYSRLIAQPCARKLKRASAFEHARSGQQEIPKAEWAGCAVREVDLKSEDSGWMASPAECMC